MVVLALGACEDASRMFTGRWEATAALDEDWLDGRPELVLGHFGAELTGVVFYNDALGVVPQPACPCAFVDQDRLDLDDETLVVKTDRCGAAPLVWTLTRVEDDDGNFFLDGAVGPSDIEPVAVELERTDTFVPEDLRACDP